MAFFQNPFTNDFRCNLLLSDRQYNITFIIPGNAGRGDELVMAWNTAPYDLSGFDSDGNSSAILTIAFAQDRGNFRNWVNLGIDITTTAVSTAAVTLDEVVSALQADATFATFFTAFVQESERNSTPANQARRIMIRQRRPVGEFKFYIVNGQAEETLRFNARAGVAEAVCTCSRHTIENRFTYEEFGLNNLIQLDPFSAGGTSIVDDNIIADAVDKFGNPLNLDPASPQEDWQLLEGRSGLFTFKNITIDGSDRITQIIEYQAGAGVGDLAKRTDLAYSGTNTNPDQITEVPHCLTICDLVIPPSVTPCSAISMAMGITGEFEALDIKSPNIPDNLI